MAAARKKGLTSKAPMKIQITTEPTHDLLVMRVACKGSKLKAMGMTHAAMHIWRSRAHS